ncbi:MAG: cyclic nucleotide-binding domain-containing protein [Nitriliruptoraceae bacterium]
MSELVLAVGLGALSAISLPLGALTARLWQPADRLLGVLTAFGAGALLAAVTIGIVAPTVREELTLPLVAGAVAGGLAFEALNRGINARGGFLRKASTTLVYAEQRAHRRRRRLLEQLERVEVFDGLPDRELDLLAGAGRVVEYPEHRLIYGRDDPAERLHVILRGSVILDHLDGERRLSEHAAFGFRSFLAGTPHRSTAVAASDPTDVLEIPRERFLEVLEETDRLRERLCRYLTSDAVLDYLRDEHGLSDTELADWVERVEADGGRGTVRAREAPHPGSDFVSRADELRRTTLFAGLETSELERIGDRLLRKHHVEGHVFFRPGDAPDRLYLIEEGQVSLATRAGPHAGESLSEGDAFGVLSFLTGAPHVATAIATTDVTVWVLRRADLSELLAELPGLKASVQRALEEEDVQRYLREQQGAAPLQAERWARRAVRSVALARPAPEVRVTAAEHGAPMAVWLGLMLDGIPESFVIGAEATAAAGGASLIVGLFLSNYPEALSSSVGMREQGWGWRRILAMWTSLLVAAALGAGIGAIVFEGSSAAVAAGIRGVATGAMLTVIAETMLPEAFARSGSASGLATLAGFLITVLIGA